VRGLERLATPAGIHSIIESCLERGLATHLPRGGGFFRADFGPGVIEMTDLWDKRREEHNRIEAEQRAREQCIFEAAAALSPPPSSPARRSLSNRPVLLSTLIGAAGGAAGVAFASIPSALVALLLAEAVLGGIQPSDYDEGLGYLLSMYCLIMFPVGGAIVGALLAAVVGHVRAARGHRLGPLQPLPAGMLGTVVITLGVSIAAMLAFRQ
jgi:hypothetical protein